MFRLLVHWFLSAACLLLVSRWVPGFYIQGLGTALVASLLIGLINGTIGVIAKILTFPFIILTFGLFWFVINAIMLEIASVFIRGFQIRGFLPAFWASLILSVLNLIVREVV